MAQFDVYRSGTEYVVDCQADIWSGLSTRFVAPLNSAKDAPPIDRKINPTFMINGQPVVLRARLAFTTMARELRDKVTSLAEDGLFVQGAIDRVLTGY